MEEYHSIRPLVLSVLEREMPVLQEKYGVVQLRLFGSVSRLEDTPDSDIDLLYIFTPERDTYDNLFSLHEYLTSIFQRKVELVSEEWGGKRFLQSAMQDAIAVQNRSLA